MNELWDPMHGVVTIVENSLRGIEKVGSLES